MRICSFFNSDDVRFSVGSWVTFEGEGTEAKDVFHSDDYSKSDYPKETYQKDKSGITIPGSGKLIPMQLCSSGCVIDKNGKLHYMHQKGGKDILALSHIQKGVPLKTEPIPYDTIESYESK